MKQYSQHIYRLRSRKHDWAYRPAWASRLYDAWMCLIGRHSLHLSWQVGHDEGTAHEYQRTVINGGR